MFNFVVKNKQKLLFIFLILVLIGLACFFSIKKEIDYSTFRNEAIIEEDNSYNIKAEYPVFSNKKLKKKIEAMINVEINNFKDRSKKIENSTNHSYELNIQYTITKTDRLYSIHFIIYKYLGSAHYERKDLIYYYDYVDNEITNWDNLFDDKELALLELSELSRAGLKREYKEYIYKDNGMFEAGIRPLKNNYRYILFTEDGINIIFIPFQVGPWSSGEISLELDYNYVNELLTEKYKGEIDIDKVNTIDSYKRKTRNIEELKDKKLIALTFDDGPDWNTTEKLLNGLRERDAKVTFFVLGTRVRQLPNVVKKAYDDGHTIGSHTYSHKNLKNLTDKEILYEIDKANEEIEKAIGKKTNIIRPPYGEFNNNIINLSGMTFILWNIDTEDWKYKDAEAIYNHIVKNAKDGSIILLHDIYNTSVEASLMAIDTLLEEGYAFVSIEELELLDKIDLSNKNYYYRIK